jgi:hypothetical protein
MPISIGEMIATFVETGIISLKFGNYLRSIKPKGQQYFLAG